MHTRPIWCSVAALVFLGAFSTTAVRAQSTDGYHAIQVFPVVVDTASFTQRFHFRSTHSWHSTDIVVKFYPADGTAQVGAVACKTIEIISGGAINFSSLRDLCPDLSPGSAFGTLVATNTSSVPFAASSRVSNHMGIGFAAESFPASDFTPATTAVTGLRRLAAKAGTPAFQSNCFVGRLAEIATPGTPVATKVDLTLRDEGDAVLGQKQLSVKPGQLIRLLDVFAAAGIPTGDIDNAVATFEAVEESGAGLISFCTVQDNTSFGADFRIGKQESSWNGANVGAHDQSALRWNFSRLDEPVDSQLSGAAFAIPAGASRNVHLVYFRHPDSVGCVLTNQTQNELSPADGLEMRLRVLDSDGWRVLAGGNNGIYFYNLYLGDKPSRGGGATTSYQIEVESNGQNEGAHRPYGISCSSGSGSTRAILIRKGLPTTF